MRAMYERKAVPPTMQQLRDMAELGLLPVEVDTAKIDAIDPRALAEAIGVNTAPATLQELGRLGERVALAALIKSVLDPCGDEKIRAANMRALLQGWSKAPTTIANLNINVDTLPQEELLALGERMFARTVVDVQPLGQEPRGPAPASPLEIGADG